MNGYDMFYNGAMALGSKIAENKRERELTKTLQAMFGKNQQGGNSNNAQAGGNGNNIDYAQAITNAFSPDKMKQNFIQGMPSGNYTADTAGIGTSGTAGSGQGTQATAPQYNAGSDYGVDLNNPYSMAIMNAKNDYQRAQKLGDEAGMLRAHAVAEQARQQAQQAGANVQSFLANNNADYAKALAMNDQLRQAQVDGNQNFSYEDLANGKMLQPQTTNPTQGVAMQSPISAGQATANPAQGVQAPTVGNQNTAQTPTAPNTYDIQAGWNKIQNQMTGGSANPFQWRGKMF